MKLLVTNILRFDCCRFSRARVPTAKILHKNWWEIQPRRWLRGGKSMSGIFLDWKLWDFSPSVPLKIAHLLQFFNISGDSSQTKNGIFSILTHKTGDDPQGHSQSNFTGLFEDIFSIIIPSFVTIRIFMMFLLSNPKWRQNVKICENILVGRKKIHIRSNEKLLFYLWLSVGKSPEKIFVFVLSRKKIAQNDFYLWLPLKKLPQNNFCFHFLSKNCP